MEINRIYNENNLTTMANMPDGFVDLVVTSPPYDDLRNYNGYSFDFESTARQLFRIIKPGGVVVWVVGDAVKDGSETGTSFKQALFFKETGFNIHDTMIFHKYSVPRKHNRYSQEFEYMFVLSKGKPKAFHPITTSINSRPECRIPARNKTYGRKKNGEFYKGYTGSNSDVKIIGNVWHYNVGFGHSSSDAVSFGHPATFPEKLAADHIKSWSDEGNLVYDPFGGSGTTAKMAHLLKRNWILSEISPEYCRIAARRMKPYIDQLLLF